MSKWTKKQIEDFSKLHNEISEKLDKLIEVDNKSKRGDHAFYGDRVSHFSIEKGEIHFEVEIIYQGDYPDYYNYVISFDELLNKTAENIIVERRRQRDEAIAKRKEEEKKRLEEEKINIAKRKEEHDLKEYKRLKKKFGVKR